MPATVSQPQSSSELPVGYRLGEYVIESVLGKGGFGITYKAQDTKLSSTVAIKEYFPQTIASRGNEHTIKPFAKSVDDFNWGLQEFLKEARALARFKHQHIVRVLRFVEANDTAYMVMEYEEGESLDNYLKRSGGYLNEQMLLGVFIPVLNGLQAVHDAGLLHLDIKPDNIYLRVNGQPMLIDFGSARQSKGEVEQLGKIALTPAYSAIEQYPGIGETGPWSDVYSMGATLYRCITGRSPVDSLQRYKAKQARHVDPYVSTTEFERPIYSKHIRASVDLAMELMPADRPQSAALFQKALMGQRITPADNKKSIRPSGNYRADLTNDVGSPMTVVRRKKGRGFIEKMFFFLILVPALAVFVIHLMVRFGLLSETEMLDRIDAFETQAESTFEAVDARLYQKWGIRIKPEREQSNVAATDTAVPASATPATKPFTLEKTVVHRLSGHRAEIVSLALLRGGDALASLDVEGRVRLWDTITGQSLYRLGAKTQIIGAITASPDGKHLAWSVGETISLHNVDSRKEAGTITGHTGNVHQIAWSPNGSMLASASDDRVVSVWQLPERNLLHKTNTLSNDIRVLTFSPNGRLLAIADVRGEIRIVSSTNGAEIARFFGLKEGDEILALAYSPDGHWLASSGPNGFLKLWDTGIDVNDREFSGVSGALRALQFSPDSKRLLAVDDKNTIQVWDVASGTLVRDLNNAQQQISAFALSADGEVLVTDGASNSIHVWR